MSTVLTQTLVRLRQALGDTAATSPFLLLTSATVQLNPAIDIQVDVTEFVTVVTPGLRTANMAQLESALALYQGELLAGFALADSEMFEEWLLLKREYLHRLAVDTAHTLTVAHLTAGDYAKAQRFAQRQLALDSWRETAHRQLMEALAHSGQRAAALLQYETCRRVLLTELGVEPEAETAALYEQIRSGEFGKVTRWQGDKVTSLQDDPVTLSTPHPVTLSPLHDWSEAPDLGPFYGRETELATVTQWLGDASCRVVALVGIGGVGKTALAAQAIGRMAAQFELVIWRSLLNAPAVETVLRACVNTLSAQQLGEWPTSLDAQLDLLFTYLRQRRCLLVLDNLESILPGNETTAQARADYAGYGQLLLRLGQARHASVLLLTSREEPPEFARLTTNDSRPGAVRTLHVQGLTNVAAQTLLQQHGMTGAQSTSDLEALVQHYSGHPLALKLVADAIRDFYGGDVEAFLGEEAPLFADIRAVLTEQFGRLAPLEQEILLWLAIERAPVTLATLQTDLFQSPARWAVLEAVRNLRRRSLLETHANSFTLQNVITEFLTSYLVDEVRHELSHAAPNRLIRHALRKASAREYVQQAQTRFFLQPLARWLATNLGETRTHTLFTRLLDNLRSGLTQESATPTGYAAGNLLNLLLQLGYPTAGYDFSGVSVWQVHLAERAAPGLDLRGADLTGSVFTDTFATITSLQFMPDGQRLVASCADGTLRLWQVADGQPLGVYTGHTGLLWSVAVSPDGRLLASGGGDGEVRIWAAQPPDETTGANRSYTMQPVHILRGHLRTVMAVAFSPDGSRLVSGGWGGTLRIWRVADGAPIHALREPMAALEAVAFHPDGRLLASGGIDKAINIWESERGVLLHTLLGHAQGIAALAFSPDGTLLASGSRDHTIRLWDTATWQLHSTLIGHSDAVRALAFGASGQTLVSGSFDRMVRVWDIANTSVSSGRPVRTLHGHTGWAEAVAFSPDGVTVASGGSDQTVRIWDINRGHALHTLSGRVNWTPALACSPDGTTLASGHWDHKVRLWDMRAADEGRLLRTLDGHTDWIAAVAFSPDGTRVVSGGSDPAVRVWDVSSGKQLHLCQGHTHSVTGVAFSPDGAFIASSSGDHTVRLWEVNGGRLRHTLAPQMGWMMTLAFSPTGRILITGHWDGAVRCWDVATWRLLHTFAGHTGRVLALAFSPDETRLVSSDYTGTVRLWSLVNQTELAVWQEHAAPVRSLTFAPDGILVASGSDDQKICLWDSQQGVLQQSWRAHPIRTMAVVFCPTATAGLRLASGGCDEVIKLWDAPNAACLATLRSPGPYAGMNITGVTGISDAQKAALRALGAVEE